MSTQVDDTFSVADIMDSQLETYDKQQVGRVADIAAQWREDGTLVLTHLVTGPQALAGQIATPLRTLLRRWLHDRFEHHIPLSEVSAFGPTIHLRGQSSEYPLGQADRWIAQHIFRWLPGSGHS